MMERFLSASVELSSVTTSGHGVQSLRGSHAREAISSFMVVCLRRKTSGFKV
ncbi:hypothetical protein Mapa_014015 [Marchantia paleacea]|nr:hypothetical protein Mapa_014015 [Marchantia paleacea]